LSRVLVLDDHYRKFYLGDACFWFLYNTRRTIHSVSGDTACRINCANSKVFPLLTEMFRGSFGNNTVFNNTDWEEIDFSEYDLVLCHPDSILKLLAFMDRSPEKLFANTSVYYYNHMTEPRQVSDRHRWNYSMLIREKPDDAAARQRERLLQTKHKAIVITTEERRWADAWMLEQGVQENEKVVVIVDSASSPDKLLSEEVLSQMVRWWLSMPGYKLLFFDEKRTGKKARLCNSFGVDLFSKMVVAEGFGIRKDMLLMAGNQVAAVIGPCTGLLHLANGIYSYLKSAEPRETFRMPLLLVYTGRLKFLGNGYHPNEWWLATAVKCAIICKDTSGKKCIKKITQVPRDKDSYAKIALPVSEISFELLRGFIEQHLPDAVQARERLEYAGTG
ncbi:MAG: hypothetical protein KGO82_18010, partial [Bacteroidota bacterium]|nr:hypothetical protein [Bacteroidota bacterium]